MKMWSPCLHPEFHYGPKLRTTAMFPISLQVKTKYKNGQEPLHDHRMCPLWDLSFLWLISRQLAFYFLLSPHSPPCCFINTPGRPYSEFCLPHPKYKASFLHLDIKGLHKLHLLSVRPALTPIPQLTFANPDTPSPFPALFLPESFLPSIYLLLSLSSKIRLYKDKNFGLFIQYCTPWLEQWLTCHRCSVSIC